MSEFFDRILRKYNIDANDYYSILKLPDEDKYIKYSVWQHNGKRRVIEQPINSKMIEIQRLLLKDLEEEYSKFIPPSVHGFVKNRSIITNAKEHLKSEHKYVLKLDIKDFFTSITYQRVYKLIQNVYKFFNPSSSMAFASMVTRLGHLPQGAPTSPIISNMICKKMDNSLIKFAKQCGGVYTRYADDVTFSFNKPKYLSLFFEDESDISKPYKLSKQLLSIFSINGFTLNESKTKLITNNLTQYICGISIKGDEISVRRKFLLDLRHQVHYCKVNKIKPNKSLIGKLSYLRQVNGVKDKNSIKYCSIVNELMVPPFPDADFYKNAKYDYALKKYLIYIELLDSGDYGTAFFSHNYLITSAHVIENDSNRQATDPKRYHNVFKIYYYDFSKEKATCKERLIEVKELYVYNEIALIKFDGIEFFENRNLPLNGKMHLSENDKVMVLGFAGVKTKKSLISEKRESFVIGVANRMNSECYMFQQNTIYKGMSGGPVLDSKTFKVCGVNYLGQKPGETKEEYPQNYGSVIDKTTLKKMKRII